MVTARSDAGYSEDFESTVADGASSAAAEVSDDALSEPTQRTASILESFDSPSTSDGSGSARAAPAPALAVGGAGGSPLPSPAAAPDETFGTPGASPPTSDGSVLSTDPLGQAEARLAAEEADLASLERAIERATELKLREIWRDKGLSEAAARDPARARSRRERMVLSKRDADVADVERQRAAARAEVARQRLYFEQARVARGSPPRKQRRTGARTEAGAVADAAMEDSTGASVITEDMPSTAGGSSASSPIPSEILGGGSDGESGAVSDVSGSSAEQQRRVDDLQGMLNARKREASKLALAVKERSLAAELEAVDAVVKANRAALETPVVVPPMEEALPSDVSGAGTAGGASAEGRDAPSTSEGASGAAVAEPAPVLPVHTAGTATEPAPDSSSVRTDSSILDETFPSEDTDISLDESSGAAPAVAPEAAAAEGTTAAEAAAIDAEPASPTSEAAATSESIEEESAASFVSDTSSAGSEDAVEATSTAAGAPLSTTLGAPSAPAELPERPSTSRGRAAGEDGGETDGSDELIEVESGESDSDGFEEYTTDDLELDEDEVDAEIGAAVVAAGGEELDTPVPAVSEPPPPQLRIDAAYAADFVAAALADSNPEERMRDGGPEAVPISAEWLERRAAARARAEGAEGAGGHAPEQAVWDRALLDAVNEALMELGPYRPRGVSVSGVALQGEHLSKAVQAKVASWLSLPAKASVDAVLAADALADEATWLMLEEEQYELKLELADAIFEDLVEDAVGALDRAETVRNRVVL